jgi:phospholipid/cholesterol/gamma-HCH transport system permease protein
MKQFFEAFFGAVGYRTLMFFGRVNDVAQLTLDALYWLTIAPLKGKGLRWKSSVEQMVLIGVNSIPIISILSILVGMILALQGAYVLRDFGAALYVADLVGVTMTRELAPLIVAVILAGRSGSAFAAEIGTMKVSEEVDALVTIGLNPTKFLVIPKLLAIVIMQPCLTLISDVVSMFGGMLIGMGLLNVEWLRYVRQTRDALLLQDIMTGLIKAVVFAIIIAIVGCYEGFQVEGGAEGVGIHTTASVVKSIFFIIMADLVVTTFFFYFL